MPGRTRVTRLLTLIVLPLLAATIGAAEVPEGEETTPTAVFSDRIDVALSTFDVRVVDGMWRPVTGLGAADFQVRLGGEPAPVVAVDWIPAPGDPLFGELDVAAGAGAPGHQLPQHSQRVVFLFQAGLTPGKAIGHLRMLPRLQELVHELPSTTLAAVASFHSHLTLHQDLTLDRQRLAAAMEPGHGFHRAALPRSSPGRPALARHLDEAAMRRVVDPAVAVELVVRALAAEPGAASVVYVGWSLEGSSAEWSSMLDTLLAAGVPLFVLDVTDADYHTLEGRLRFSARQTGGDYSGTRDFPGREVTRVGHMLAGGHYRIAVRRPDLPAGFHPLRVTLNGRGGYRRVLAPQRLAVVRHGEGSAPR